MNKDTLEKIKEVIMPVLASNKYDLVDVEFKIQPEGKVLTVYIDKDGGVTLKDCEDVSMVLSAIFDTYNFIEDEYILEVSSPGIYRELKNEKDFERYMGHRIKVKLYESTTVDNLGKQKVFVGTLVGYSEDVLKIKLDNELEISLNRKNIAKVNLEPDITDLLKKLR